MNYFDLMVGAGLGDVIIPKKEFIKEHERLVKLLNQSDLPSLRKEAKDQKAELKMRGGAIIRMRTRGLPLSLQFDILENVRQHAGATGAPPRSSEYDSRYNEWMETINSFLQDDDTIPFLSSNYPHNMLAFFQTLPLFIQEENAINDNTDNNQSIQLLPLEVEPQPVIDEHFNIYHIPDNNDDLPSDNDEMDGSGRGGSGKSNFIARMMAEAKYKHRDPSEKDKPYAQTKTGKYRKPVMDPERDDTKMSQAVKFDYKKIANKNQSGSNKEAYGASPFITHHFGLVPSAHKPKETAAQTAARRKFSGREPVVKSAPKVSQWRPSLLFENKIRELIRPTKALVRKGESAIRTPAEQREVDNQLKEFVREMDEQGYDPNRLGIKNFNPDKYRD